MKELIKNVATIEQVANGSEMIGKVDKKFKILKHQIMACSF